MPPAAVSHPVWVRGLKLLYCDFHLKSWESHPVRVRGLKPLVNAFAVVESRPPVAINLPFPKVRPVSLSLPNAALFVIFFQN
jgi:hypothetical protein